MKTRENSWHCCAFVGSFTTQKWPSWNCLPRSPTLLGRCELFFFVILAMQKDLCYPNHPLHKWVHSEKATSAFWMVQIHISSRHFFQDDQLELGPHPVLPCVGSLPPQPHPQVASLLVILSLVLMAPRPGALATPEVVEVFGQAAPVLGYPAPPFNRWLLPGLAGGNLARKIWLFLGNFFFCFLFLDEDAKMGYDFGEKWTQVFFFDLRQTKSESKWNWCLSPQQTFQSSLCPREVAVKLQPCVSRWSGFLVFFFSIFDQGAC